MGDGYESHPLFQAMMAKARAQARAEGRAEERQRILGRLAELAGQTPSLSMTVAQMLALAQQPAPQGPPIVASLTNAGTVCAPPQQLPSMRSEPAPKPEERWQRRFAEADAVIAEANAALAEVEPAPKQPDVEKALRRLDQENRKWHETEAELADVRERLATAEQSYMKLSNKASETQIELDRTNDRLATAERELRDARLTYQVDVAALTKELDIAVAERDDYVTHGISVAQEREMLRAQVEKLKREGVPGVMHEVDAAFYKLSISERDYARAQVERLTKERDEARAGLAKVGPAPFLLVQELRAQVERLTKERDRYKFMFEDAESNLNQQLDKLRTIASKPGGS